MKDQYGEEFEKASFVEKIASRESFLKSPGLVGSRGRKKKACSLC